MVSIRFIFLVIAIGCIMARPIAAQSKEAPKLEPWTHTYDWKEFTLTKAAPTSDDGRYRLKRVRKNGEVELFYSPAPEQKEVILVKPMPKEFKRGVHPPTIVVKSFDADQQVATIRELRIK